MIEYYRYKDNPYLMLNFLDRVDAIEFKEIMKRQKQLSYRDTINAYYQLTDNLKIKEIFPEIYENNLFEVKYQYDLAFTIENQHEFHTKYKLFKLFTKCNKLKYIVNEFEETGEYDHLIVIYLLMINDYKYDKSINRYLSKYKLFDLLYQLINVDKINASCYKYDFYERLLNLIYENKEKLKQSELKKLLKRIQLNNNEKYNELFNSIVSNVTPIQFIDIKKNNFNKNFELYVDILTKYKYDYHHIISGIKKLKLSEDIEKYLSLLFDKKVLNKSNIDDFYIKLICYNEFVYSLPSSLNYNSTLKRIDNINIIFINNGLNINKTCDNMTKYKLNGLYTLNNNPWYGSYTKRYDFQIDRLIMLNRKSLIKKLV